MSYHIAQLSQSGVIEITTKEDAEWIISALQKEIRDLPYDPDVRDKLRRLINGIEALDFKE